MYLKMLRSMFEAYGYILYIFQAPDNKYEYQLCPIGCMPTNYGPFTLYQLEKELGKRLDQLAKEIKKHLATDICNLFYQQNEVPK